MKKTKELHELRVGQTLRMAVITIGLVLSLSLFGGCFSIVSHAESAGRVIASGGANVRSSTSSNASLVTSYPQNTVISIRSQIQASDGYIWYEVWATADTLGYVRSDLVEITDGTTPPTSTEVAATEPGSTNNNQGQAEVTAVNPISATVIGGGTSGVRIRSNASTSSQIVILVNNDLALTVTGQANSLDGDNRVWYEVNFFSNGSEVSGFIRSDFVQLSGELTPYTPTVDPDPEPGPEEGTDSQPNTQEEKEYDTLYQNGTWYLFTPDDPIHGYDIVNLLERLNEYPDLYEESVKDVKTQKVVIVILVFLLVAAAGGIGFLIFKIKDMMDSAYFNQVENETLRRRSEQRTQGGRGMPTVGSDKKGAPQGQRPSGARPAGAPQGQRPAGAPQGQRPAGAPQSQRPAGAPQGQRPTGAPQGQRPTGAPQGQRPEGASQGQGASGQKPKNFMAEDDEFEFEFLNYEGDDEK